MQFAVGVPGNGLADLVEIQGRRSCATWLTASDYCRPGLPVRGWGLERKHLAFICEIKPVMQLVYF